MAVNVQDYYHELAALYKEYVERAKVLYDEFEARVNELDPTYDPDTYDPNDLCHQVSNIFSYCSWLQVYPKKPSNEADEPRYISPDDGTKYYDLYVDGVRFTEAVEEA